MSTRVSPRDTASAPKLHPSETNTFGHDVALDGAEAVPQQEGLASNGVLTDMKFHLLGLPPELRLMIYRPLIRIGDLSILEVSKLVSQEAVPLLSKHGVLRVNVGRRYQTLVKIDPPFDLTAGVTLSGRPTLIALDYIQHVNFRIDMVNWVGPDVDLRFINYFEGNKITRESCVITISVNEFAEVPPLLDINKTYCVIAALTGFKVLMLKLECETHAEAKAAIQKKYGLEVVQMGEERTGRLLLRRYEKVMTFLQTTLGPADFPNNVYRDSLRFRPVQYKTAQVAAAKASGGEV